MRSITLVAVSCVEVSLLLLLLTTLVRVECTKSSRAQVGEPEALVVPKREGRIADLSNPLHTGNLKAESVTILRAQQQQLKLNGLNSINAPQTPAQVAQARGRSPALQRLIAQSQATKVDTISGGGDGEQVSRARSYSGGGGGKNHEALSPTSAKQEAPTPPSARQAKCVIQHGGRGRSLREILTSAKNLATGGFSSMEQRAGNIFWFGSNVLATLIPLASLLPSALGLATTTTTAGTKSSTSDQRLPIDGANQTASATNKRASGSLLSPQKLIVSLASNAGGLQSRVEHVMGWLERSIEHLPNFPRLHPQECVKRCICEAHADPTKYGALGLTLRLLFPATQLSILEGQDNMEYKVINKYRHAAGYGMARRVMVADSAGPSTGDGNNNSNSTTSGGGGGGWTSSGGEFSSNSNNLAATAACKEKYEDCLVSLLDVAQNLVDFFLNKS